MPDNQSSVIACPLCQQDNNCAVSQGLSLAECWCQNENLVFDKLTHEQVAVVKINPLSCICQSCATNLKSTNEC